MKHRLLIIIKKVVRSIYGGCTWKIIIFIKKKNNLFKEVFFFFFLFFFSYTFLNVPLNFSKKSLESASCHERISKIKIKMLFRVSSLPLRHGHNFSKICRPFHSDLSMTVCNVPQLPSHGIVQGNRSSHTSTCKEVNEVMKSNLNQEWSLSAVNPKVVRAEYAVRGLLALRAEELQRKLETHPGSLPFSKILTCNIGNPQQLGQRPITFLRQLSSLLEYPTLLESENEALVSKLFPSDAIQRAKTLLSEIKSVGAYTHSQGIFSIRKHVAEFIQARDNGIPSNACHIFLTNGASAGIQTVLQTIVSGPKDAVMIPVPQYPIYTATLSLCGAEAVPYYLNEENSWQIDTSSFQLPTSLNVKAICVINPGNPTGNVLTRSTIENILRFSEKQGWMILADEVYQSNVYEGEFFSFKRVAYELQIKSPIISFHSVSKGVFGECGRRGGYFECYNVHENIIAQFYKLASICLCPAVQGQVAVCLF
ncbi:hypothetical protein HMI55_001984 [Coelomomyces lativittatus]|nr:hypothetical protein HMI55_001984 [Coelomomyces lativittatus]